MIFGTHDPNTLQQFEHIRKGAVKAALMADGHYGYIMPVGGVAAYENQISVNGVGFDIACGNCAIKTDLTVEKLTGIALEEAQIHPEKPYHNRALNQIANEIAETISFGLGRRNKADDAPVDHPLFLDPAWKAIPKAFREDLKEKARRQLGTVGSGNHYVDVFMDTNDGHLWVGVHFGSRGFGHTIATNFLAIGQGGTWGGRAKEVETMLALGTPAGDDYWALMQLAGQYAYAGREWAARTVVKILGAEELDLVHNHHNYAWKELHTIDGVPKELIVVRKGATPAFPNQKGFVGGSMGDNAVILQGSEDSGDTKKIQELSLYSTVHGAGRVMSRTEASGKRNFKTGRLLRDNEGKVIRPGKVSPAMMQEWVKEKGVILRGGGVDESPHVYRRLTEVLAAQGATVKILHVLRPLIVVMAGEQEIDPYKD